MLRSNRRRTINWQVLHWDIVHVCYGRCRRKYSFERSCCIHISGVQGKEELATTKQQLVLKAQAVVEAAKLDYEKVTERLLREAENFKLNKAQDIRSILLRFIDLQVSGLRFCLLSNRSFSYMWSGNISY